MIFSRLVGLPVSVLAQLGLERAQIYVGAEVDDYLRQVRSQAVVRRLDVTASAVVRLAMERLMADLTPG